MKRAICLDVEGVDDDYSCKKGNYYNQCCQECDDKKCSGCDYRYDSNCVVKEWIETK